MEYIVKFIDTILKMVFYGSLCFYTTWGLFLLLLYVLGILKYYQSSLFLILLTIFYIGNIITYIFPKIIVIPYIKRTISGKFLKIFNLIFHVIPLVLFLMIYDTRIKSDNLYLAVFSILIYLLCFNPIKVYNYSCNNCKEEKIANILVLIYIVFIALLIIKQKKLL